MADRFETQLERLFAESPRMADEDDFAAQVQGRLGRGSAMRGALIGLAGLVGGGIAVAQALRVNLDAAVQSATRTPAATEASSVVTNSAVGELMDSLLARAPGGMGLEVILTVAALALAGLALLAARTFGEA